MKQNGFTLIELLIVIAVVGILASVMIPNLLVARNRANDAATVGFIRNTVSAIESQKDTLGYIPAALSDVCNVVIGVPLPSSVQDCTITYSLDRTSYTIEATSSSTKSVTWDGVAFSIF